MNIVSFFTNLHVSHITEYTKSPKRQNTGNRVTQSYHPYYG